MRLHARQGTANPVERVFAVSCVQCGEHLLLSWKLERQMPNGILVLMISESNWLQHIES